MNPDLLSANISMVFMAVAAAALLAHLSQIAGPHRLLHGVYAATAAGLFYLFGAKAFGWSFIPREALLALYATLFVVVAVAAFLRRGKEGGERVPWGGLLIAQAAMAYIFAPGNYWKPPVSALLLLYFLLELFGWLKGREETVSESGEKGHRPPLFPPRRVRGVRELALAASAAALVYVFAMGTGRMPEAAPPEELASAEEEAPAESAAGGEEAAPAESPSSETAAAAPEPEVKEPEAPATPAAPAAPAPVHTYKAAAGDTFKSIAKKLYGKAEKWRAIAAANPGLKPGAKLKAGQVIKLAEPPSR